MADKKNTSPAALLNEPMRTMYDLLCQLIDSGLTPEEARDVLYAMVGRVLETHPATMPHQTAASAERATAGSGRTYTDKQLATGRRKLHAFHRWLEDNPRAYQFGERFAINALDAGQHASGRAIVEHIRQHDLADEHGKPTRTSNNHAAIIARMFLREHPQYARRMKLRPCVFDVLMAGGAANE